MVEELQERLSLIEVDLSWVDEVKPDELGDRAAVVVELVVQHNHPDPNAGFCTAHFHSPENAIGSVRVGGKWYWLVDREHSDDPECEMMSS